ncbi:hypothetical protein [Luteibaculum oceani]|uniref:Uncharacterized protein n=1 Tax=Luteibaculum oceani TaxID=1294296 RepID=A0A5C6V4T1_9FLAO|nr:hypothetical protein [Luteibaculum oceani]TXC78778.1 hypothetical protein FRX97_06055 [Luteibaculum oceani]
MIDFIKARCTDKEWIENILVENPEHFNTNQKLKCSDGEITYPLMGNLENLRIKVTERDAYLSGSLHKYFNLKKIGKAANCDQFSFCDLIESIKLLQIDLQNYDLRKTVITQLESGFNIEVDNCQELIRNKILMEKFRLFTANGDNTRIDQRNFRRDDYVMKIYHKGKEHENEELCSYELLRFEVKITRSRVLKNMGICSLLDLKRLDCFNSIYKSLISRFKNLTIIDELNPKELRDHSSKEIILFKDGINPFYWNNLRGTDSSRKKKAFNRLLENLNLLNTKRDIMHKISQQYGFMIHGTSLKPSPSQC